MLYLQRAKVSCRETEPLQLVLTNYAGTWIAFYVITYIHPNPRRVINSTVGSWKAYTGFMYASFLMSFTQTRLNEGYRYAFGAAHSIFNLMAWGALALIALSGDLFRHRALSVAAAFIIPIIALGMIIMPTFGGIIVRAPIQAHAYKHMCDNSGAQVVLDGRSYKEPPFVASVTKFYQSASSRQIFTFELQQTNLSTAVLQFRSFNADATTLPSQLVPSLRSITYSFDRRQLTGSCDGVEGSCLNGTFDIDWLAMDLTSNTTGAVIHTRSQSQHDRWLWDQDSPSLVLRAVADDGTLGDIILQTAVSKVNDCTSLKVCINGSGNEPVGPEVLAPLGIILSKQASHSYICTMPEGNSTRRHSF